MSSIQTSLTDPMICSSYFEEHALGQTVPSQILQTISESRRRKIKKGIEMQVKVGDFVIFPDFKTRIKSDSKTRIKYGKVTHINESENIYSITTKLGKKDEERKKDEVYPISIRHLKSVMLCLQDQNLEKRLIEIAKKEQFIKIAEKKTVSLLEQAECFLQETIETYLDPYLKKKISLQASDYLADRIVPVLKEKFPTFHLTDKEWEIIILSVYIQEAAKGVNRIYQIFLNPCNPKHSNTINNFYKKLEEGLKFNFRTPFSRTFIRYKVEQAFDQINAEELKARIVQSFKQAFND